MYILFVFPEAISKNGLVNSCIETMVYDFSLACLSFEHMESKVSCIVYRSTGYSSRAIEMLH